MDQKAHDVVVREKRATATLNLWPPIKEEKEKEREALRIGVPTTGWIAILAKRQEMIVTEYGGELRSIGDRMAIGPRRTQ